MPDVNAALAAADQASKREAVRTSLQKRFGRAVPVTEAMVDSVLAELYPGKEKPARASRSRA